MEKKIRIEALQKTFVVEFKDVAKAKRNRSYLNASPCCSAKVNQKKFCSECDKEVDVSQVQRKLVKVGKDYHAVPKEKLDEVIDAFEDMEDINVVGVVPYDAQFGEVFKEGLIALGNSKTQRKANQYSELKALAENRILIANGVVRKNEFQMLIFVLNDRLYIRKLVSAEQLYPEFEVADFPLNESIVAIENKILDKLQTEDFDLRDFTDTRQVKEEEIIEKFVLGKEELPEMEITEQAEVKEDKGELERMEKLLAQLN